SHYWNFGDLLSVPNDTSTKIDPSHKFSNYGSFYPKLLIQNRVGCSDSVVKQVKVYKLPFAAFSFPDLICSRAYIEFTNQSKAGDSDTLSWLWNLGSPDNPENISIEQDPVAYYDSAGTYNIFLKIQDSYGCKDSVSNPITVLPSPISSFNVEQNVNDIAGNVLLTNTSTGAIAYLWEFGDGLQSSPMENPEMITYKDNGTYTIMLIASAFNKCTDTTRYNIEILFRGLYVPNAFAPLTTDPGTRLFKPAGV